MAQNLFIFENLPLAHEWLHHGFNRDGSQANWKELESNRTSDRIRLRNLLRLFPVYVQPNAARRCSEEPSSLRHERSLASSELRTSGEQSVQPAFQSRNSLRRSKSPTRRTFLLPTETRPERRIRFLPRKVANSGSIPGPTAARSSGYAHFLPGAEFAASEEQHGRWTCPAVAAGAATWASWHYGRAS